MNDIYRLDKARVRTSFDHAAESYDAAAVLQAESVCLLIIVPVLPVLIL